MDRNVSESARKGYQHVSESGAAMVMLWDLPVNKSNLRHTIVPIQLYSIILATSRVSPLVSSYKKAQKQHSLKLAFISRNRFYDRTLEDLPY